jgi:hypothetical protein
MFKKVARRLKLFSFILSQVKYFILRKVKLIYKFLFYREFLVSNFIFFLFNNDFILILLNILFFFFFFNFSLLFFFLFLLFFLKYFLYSYFLQFLLYFISQLFIISFNFICQYRRSCYKNTM